MGYGKMIAKKYFPCGAVPPPVYEPSVFVKGGGKKSWIGYGGTQCRQQIPGVQNHLVAGIHVCGNNFQGVGKEVVCPPE